MGEAFNSKMGEVSLEYGPAPFGKEMLKHFLFNPDFKNLNQGIFRRSIWSYMHIDNNQQAPLVLSLESSARSRGSTRTLAN
jgi:hypothetical protein